MKRFTSSNKLVLKDQAQSNQINTRRVTDHSELPELLPTQSSVRGGTSQKNTQGRYYLFKQYN